MKSVITFFGLSCMLLASCGKKDAVKVLSNDNRSIADIISDYQAFANRKVAGAFVIQSLKFSTQPRNSNTARIGGAFYDNNNNTRAGGIVTIGSFSLKPNASNFYGLDQNLPTSNFFGQKVHFTLNPSSSTPLRTSSTDQGGGSFDGSVDGELYVPAEISASLSNNLADPSNVITWNPDPTNPNGIVIVAEYNPELTLNADIQNAGYNTIIQNSYPVPDNGSATLPPDFFSGFPPGSQIILYVGRGSYTIITSGYTDYKVSSYTAAMFYILTVPGTITPPAGPPPPPGGDGPTEQGLEKTKANVKSGAKGKN